MPEIRGKGVFGGIAIGKISVYKKKLPQIVCESIADTEQELARFYRARETAICQLKGLCQKVLAELGEAEAQIFEMHQLMLTDEEYVTRIEQMICGQQVNADYAVVTVGEQYAQLFTALEDDYVSARAADMKDVSDRLLSALGEEQSYCEKPEEPVIIVAEDLSPSETAQLDREKILAIVTVQGAVNSHTAILARTMGIPALVGAELSLDEKWNDKLGIVDGVNGVFYVEPDAATLACMREMQTVEAERKEQLHQLIGKEDITKDGRRVMLYANINGIEDLASVAQNDAAGIGLFRSEFIYLERDCFPTEEEQFQIYRTVAEAMAGKKVIVRTLDIGTDKQCGYFDMEPEENPALGCRGIRISLKYPEVFKAQLRALLRAAVSGNLAILYPMITGVEEVKRIQAIVSEVQEELTASGIKYGNPEQGIMIETPAAVMMSDELAKEVDFFSIGTNDLTQYTLAIDRRNSGLEPFYDAHHPAVMKMIAVTVENAHRAGIKVGICGELAADTTLTEAFLEMGIDELSVAPASILPVRKRIREIEFTQ